MPLVRETPAERNEGANGFRGKAAAAEAGEGGHAGIVPSADALLLHELEELALAEQGVGEVEAVEFNLLRREDAELLNVPAIEGLMVGELERAHGVGDVLDGVGLAVRVVVHGIDAPLVAGAVVRGVEDAVHDRIAHVEVGRGHVDFGAEDAAAVGELALLHADEEVEIFFDGPVAIRAVFAGLGEGAAVLADFVGGEVVDVGLAGLDELDGPLVELAEVVGGVAEALPVEAEPADVFLDGVDVLLLFFFGIGVVEAQVGFAAELVGEAEVDADGLGVADVEVAVGLGGKAGLDDGVAELFGADVLGDDVVEEVGGGGSVGGVGVGAFRIRVVIAGVSFLLLLFHGAVLRQGGRVQPSDASCSSAWRMRARQASRPRTTRVSKSGGAFLRPQTATRMG